MQESSSKTHQELRLHKENKKNTAHPPKNDLIRLACNLVTQNGKKSGKRRGGNLNRAHVPYPSR